MTYLWLIFSIFALIVSSLHMIFYKLLTKSNIPNDICISLVFIISGILSLIYLFFNRDRLKINECKLNINKLCAGAIIILLFNFFLLKSIDFSPKTSYPLLIINLNIILTAILSYFIFKEKISYKVFLGILLTVIGLSIVIYYSQ